MLLRKSYFGLLVVAVLAISSPANANCFGEFERPGTEQFAYILVFAETVFGGQSPHFRGVVGPSDQLDYMLVTVTFSEKEAKKIVGQPPMVLAVLGDVEILDSGLRLVNVRTVLRSLDEVQDAKKMSDSKFPGNCGSTFSQHWRAA